MLCCVQDAVLAGHLKSATYQRLMVAVIAKSTLYLGAFLLVSTLHASLQASASDSSAVQRTTLQRIAWVQSQIDGQPHCIQTEHNVQSQTRHVPLQHHESNSHRHSTAVTSRTRDCFTHWVQCVSTCAVLLPCCSCLQSPELWSPVLVSFYPTAAAASIAINVAVLQAAFKQAGAETFTSGLQSMWGFSTPKNAASWGYSVAILLYIATGMSHLTIPSLHNSLSWEALATPFCHWYLTV